MIRIDLEIVRQTARRARRRFRGGVAASVGRRLDGRGAVEALARRVAAEAVGGRFAALGERALRDIGFEAGDARPRRRP